ncbi:TetR/AcrR family transcriptional regulator [Desulfocicer niacini]
MGKITRKKELLDNMIKVEISTTVLELISRNQPITMDVIAAQCGVAKGTLYNYFKNKKVLINHVHQTLITPKVEQNQAIFESDNSPKTKLHDFVDSVFNFHNDYPLYFQFIQSQRTASEFEKEKFETVVHPLVRLCREGIHKGVFVDLDPFVMASMIFGTVIGTMQTFHNRDETAWEMDKIKKDVICLLDRMILKEKEKP